MKSIWENVEDTVITICWIHTGIVNEIVGEELNVQQSSKVLDQDRTKLQEIIDEVVLPRLRISMADLVYPVDQDECIEVVAEDELVAQVVNEIRPKVRDWMTKIPHAVFRFRKMRMRFVSWARRCAFFTTKTCAVLPLVPPLLA